MNIQIFGRSKCFDTKKAERYFKERRIRVQQIDLLRYMDDVRAKEDKLFERPELMRTPVVRNGRKATVGYCPDVWKQWEESEK